MGEKYQIRIVNKTNDDQTYFLFQAPPETTFSKDVFTNIYGQSPLIQGGGKSSTTFEITNKFFAIVGIPPAGGLAHGTKISSSSHADVKLGAPTKNLGTLWHLTTSHDSPFWEEPPTSVTAPDGFGIATDHSFKFPNKHHWFLGVGAQDPFDQDAIVPVATVTARPGTRYIFRPKVTFYICTGKFEQGTVIDWSAVGTKLEVNFDKEDLDDIAFEHTTNGEYKRLRSFY